MSDKDSHGNIYADILLRIAISWTLRCLGTEPALDGQTGGVNATNHPENGKSDIGNGLAS